MAENSKLTGIELNGVLYSLGKSIYEELDMSLERFAELLGRDLYCPTLTAAPTSSTLTYTDTDGSTNTFQTGQPCRWADGSDYRIAVCKNITASASSWYIFPAKVSELTNDAGYLTEHQDISGKLDATTAASTYLSKTDAASTYLGKTAKAASATTADSATKATQDASGNVITTTYATKTEVSAKVSGDGNITNIVKVTALPDSPDANTLYIIVEG